MPPAAGLRGLPLRRDLSLPRPPRAVGGPLLRVRGRRGARRLGALDVLPAGGLPGAGPDQQPEQLRALPAAQQPHAGERLRHLLTGLGILAT